MSTKCKSIKIELLGTDEDIDRLAEFVKKHRAVLRVNVNELLGTEPATPSVMSSCNRGQKYPGFGEEHTNAEWARRLGIPRNSLWRYLQRGLTIELIAKYRGIKYHAE